MKQCIIDNDLGLDPGLDIDLDPVLPAVHKVQTFSDYPECETWRAAFE